MASNVILGIILNPQKFERIKIENIDLDGKVENLKNTAVIKINKSKQEIELMYAGVILEDSASLSSYGIKTGVMVHVLNKLKVASPTPTRILLESERIAILSAFQEFGLSSRFRAALQKLSKRDVIEKVIAASPGLAEDSAAISLIQDPDLILQLGDETHQKRILDAHPCLINAALFIKSLIREDAVTINHNQASTSTGYSYSLDALSDDDDMDSNETPREGNPLQRNASYNAITAAQLAAAIANASTNFTSTGAVVNSSSNPNGNVITSEMFGNALQQAFASSPVNNVAPIFPAPTPNEEETIDAIRIKLQQQLLQMREMGLSNESQNIRALQATSGDVHAAIELVFNGVID